MLARLAKCRKGATAIEYALIAALVGVGGVAAYSSTGTSVAETYCAVGKKLPGGENLACSSGTPATPEPVLPWNQCMINEQAVWDSNNNYCWGGTTNRRPWWAASPDERAAGQYPIPEGY